MDEVGGRDAVVGEVVNEGVGVGSVLEEVVGDGSELREVFAVIEMVLGVLGVGSELKEVEASPVLNVFVGNCPVLDELADVGVVLLAIDSTLEIGVDVGLAPERGVGVVIDELFRVQPPPMD